MSDPPLYRLFRDGYFYSMIWLDTPEDAATRVALWRGFGLVIVPAMLAIFVTIWWLSPPRVPVSQSWANGIYENACCAPLLLRDGTISTGRSTAHYTVIDDKRGFMIEVERGIGVRDGAVVFGSSLVYVPFNRNSEAMPALTDAYALHLLGLGSDYKGYVFMKRCALGNICKDGKLISSAVQLRVVQRLRQTRRV